MTNIVVLGAGYAGVRAITTLEAEAPADVSLTWVSEYDYHLVLHEVHRCIRDPDVEESITIPITEIKSPETDFIEGRVADLDTENQDVVLESGETVAYDYVLVALGSETAFYGIPGMEEHAHTLKKLDHALDIHEDIDAATREATFEDPVEVVIGGAGLSGIQTAGEVAEYRDDHNGPINITLVEALEEIYPGRDSRIQRELRLRLEDRDVEILTNDPITEATDEAIHFENREPLEYDVLVWTGGLTGNTAMSEINVETEHDFPTADQTFQTSDDRVFAVGDCAMVETNGDHLPQTAQAAWGAARVAARNMLNAADGEPLETYSHTDKGTAISIGEDAVAHDVMFLPLKTLGAKPAVTLKKFIGARWIADITDWSRARAAWSDL